MDIAERLKRLAGNPFFHNYRTLFGLWSALAIIAWLTKYFPGKYNNYLIFKQVFWHAVNKISLYAAYPAEHHDTNHYGPVFSLLVAPFALMPLWLGLLCWLLALSLFLYAAVRTLPFNRRQKIFIYWFCAHELLTALFMSQFNIATAALILLSFVFIEKEKDIWAAFCILLGTFVKLYGIVGLAFFFFSKHKLKFSVSCVGWAIVLLVAPALMTSPEYIFSQYMEWYQSLVEKNAANLSSIAQNISFLGMVRRISGSMSYSDIYLILGGLILFVLPYLRSGQYRYAAFRQTLLASVLLFVILFSTGSESSTYIIPFVGVAIWYIVAPWKRSKLDLALMVFAFVLTSMSPSDLFPRYLRVNYVQPYALKALPCMIIWLKLSYEMCTRNYNPLPGNSPCNENRIRCETDNA